jgi:hypothetical protein
MQNVEFHNLYWLPDTGVSKNSGKTGKECGWIVMKVILDRFLIGKQEGKSPFKGLCEYGSIILKWILRKFIRMDFEYSCFGRALNNIVMKCVTIRKFDKILGNIFII